MQSPQTFPADFTWGVAAAAAQIEGAAFTDGKGESIWDRFARAPGKVHGGDNLDVACDHYHRYEEDFALMASLGVKNYRLSIAWPRIIPDGDGAVNPAGIAFYERLIDSLTAHGITPWVTLFHWDLPQSLEACGGWRSRETAVAFGRFAEITVKALASRVKHWITLNEIRCFTQLAYGYGTKAPGAQVDDATLNQIYHHALLAHGLGVQAVRKFGGDGAEVGITDNSDVCIPVMETEADIQAALTWYRRKNQHLLGAICEGGYSEAYLAECGEDAPQVESGDFDLISAPTDFLGLNLYTGPFVRAGKDGKPEEVELPPAYPKADSPWLHWAPQVIYWGTRLPRDAYGVKKIYITENGCGYNDEPLVNGEVNDLHRREFLRAHLRELQRAINDGVPVAGYFLWSFIDNFEWEDGYERRFGIVHCDFDTLKRTPKLSARYYAQVMAENRVV